MDEQVLARINKADEQLYFMCINDQNFFQSVRRAFLLGASVALDMNPHQLELELMDYATNEETEW